MPALHLTFDFAHLLTHFILLTIFTKRRGYGTITLEASHNIEILVPGIILILLLDALVIRHGAIAIWHS